MTVLLNPLLSSVNVASMIFTTMITPYSGWNKFCTPSKKRVSALFVYTLETNNGTTATIHTANNAHMANNFMVW